MSFGSDLQGTHNARGLAGLATGEGQHIADGVLFRSDSLSALTSEGVAAFGDYRIGTVIDLRTDAERTRAADVLPADGSVTLIALPVLGGAMDQMARNLMPAAGAGVRLSSEELSAILDKVPTLEQLYQGILSSSARQFAELGRAVLAAAATDRPGVIFHCTAGKDRTGIAAALLLMLAGVDRDTIVADYTQTETNLAGAFAESLTALITGFGLPLTPKLDQLATKSPASAIEAAMDWITENYGNSAGYLQSGGMTAEETDKLRSTLRV
ncbi:tyrosine-protein phosphatase [Leucobacter coleopterorum]|uniref:Tyrosine-protein phosphatase n=1 Tax=Leucobacter coleopterorum TaxID=2714933 RepID=A0ABX6JXL0_9MICO|nr:tyrosine-protein phosphatase [Leucobacter coleopterorum]QIM17674.1 tyrosine-protein phosphatase [Leucobacter coleopterorum]